MIATPSSYIGSLVELVGGNNLVQDSSMPFVTYNKEDIPIYYIYMKSG